MTDSIFNPLRTRTGKCSDWAEILTTAPSHFFKNLILLAFFFLALLKSYHRMSINIFNISDSALLTNIFENNHLLFRLAS
jgi:hypothetical protein